MKVSELLVTSRSVTGFQRTQVLSVCAGNSAMFLVVREAERFPDVSPRTWPPDWHHSQEGDVFQDPQIPEYLCHLLLFLFSLSAELLCQWREEENVLFRGMYHNKKLISTNCSKITQKLSPCSSLCQWRAVLFQQSFCLPGLLHLLSLQSQASGGQRGLPVWVSHDQLQAPFFLKQIVVVAKSMCLRQSQHIWSSGSN